MESGQSHTVSECRDELEHLSESVGWLTCCNYELGVLTSKVLQVGDVGATLLLKVIGVGDNLNLLVDVFEVVNTVRV